MLESQRHGRPQNGIIMNSPNLKVNNLNIEKVIREKLNVPIFIKNDGMCAGIAEKEYGNLKDSKNGVFLSIGTGIGTAVFIDGKLTEEVRGAGHMIIEKNGRKCNCGKCGCLETYASMKAFKTKIRERLENKNLSGKEIFKILTKEEERIKVDDLIDDYIAYLAIGVSNMARICSADTVVLGGSFVYYKDILFKRLQNELDRIMSKFERDMNVIKIAKLRNDAGMIGATLIH